MNGIQKQCNRLVIGMGKIDLLNLSAEYYGFFQFGLGVSYLRSGLYVNAN